MTTMTENARGSSAVARWTATLVSTAVAFYVLAWAVDGATRGLIV